MPMIALLLLVTQLTHAEVHPSVLCAQYLDDRDRAGELTLPLTAQQYLDEVLAQISVSRAGLPSPPTLRQRFENLKATLLRRDQRLVDEDVAVNAADHHQLFARRQAAAEMTELRKIILTSAESDTPVRRLTKGRATVIEFLTGIRSRARAEQVKLDAGFTERAEELRADQLKTRAERAAQSASLRQKIGREGAESWRKRYFGPDSDLTNPQRLGVMAGYAKNAIWASMVSGLISPVMIPITAVTFVAGWWGVRQWLYLGADHAKMFVSGFLRERRIDKDLSRVEAYRLATARAEHHLADIDAMIALAARRDRPHAVAAFTYDVEIAIDARSPDFTQALDGEIIRRAVAKATPAARGKRLVRMHHVLSFDAEGEARLATNILERTRQPKRARDWASALVILMFKR